jgi:hypothetical protein
MPSGGGCWVSAQLALMGGGGGERERGAVAPQNPGHLALVTRYSMSMLSPHDQGRNTLEPPAFSDGVGPFSLMHSARSNKSSSEGDTGAVGYNIKKYLTL